LIEFPTDSLDLGDMVGQRKVAKELIAQGVDVQKLHSVDLDEPVIYDLFGVDEHMGGLGGGHYRAYALNHRDEQWYHFDDSYVNPATAEESVVSMLIL
jgi:ubiquitin carboxyl-terminal hydrolase 4/11/15